MLLAGFIRDLGMIINFSGLTGFLILMAPEGIFISAKLKAQRYNINIPNFKKWYHHNAVVIILLAFSSVGFVLTLYSLIRDIIG